MAVDLFALRANLELTGLPQMQSGLQSVNTTGMQTAASLRGVAGGSLDVTRRIQAQEAATRGLTAQKSALSGTLSRVSRDIQTATLDFKAGRISATDHAAALSFARSEATKLGSAASMTGQQLKSYNGILNATATSTNTAAKGTGFLKDMMASGMVQFLGVTAAMGAVRSAFSTAFGAADRFANSQTMLAGIARITGVPLANLQRVSQGISRDFKLTAVQANELTAGMNKLTQAAGQPEKMRAGVEALLDIGSARGLTTVQVLSAINNALAGNDEGTDKLFMKNPSEIYKKWAIAANTTVDKMDALQRSQALLDALLTDGGKVRGEYAKWLETTPGKTQQMETATEKLAIAFGRLFTPMRNWVATGGAAVLNWAADAIDRFQRLGGLTANSAGIWATLGANASRLGAAIAGQGKEYKTDGGFRGNLGEHPGLAALGTPGKSGIDEARVKALSDGLKLNVLTKAEERERLSLVQQMRREMAGASLERRTQLGDLIKELTPKKESVRLSREEREEQQHIRDLLLEQHRIRVERAGGGNRIAGFGGTANLGDSNLAGVSVPSILQGAGVRPGVTSAARNADKSQAARQKMRDALRSDLGGFEAEVNQAFASFAGNSVAALANAFGNAFSSKKPLRQLGKNILSGLGSIFSQMGQSLIKYGAAMIGLKAALSNPFTSGPAALVAGALLLGLGTALGAAANGSGGGGHSSAPKDQITRVTLTNPGAGGQSAPEARPYNHYTIIGPDDLSAQSQLGKLMQNGSRRGIRYG